MELGRNLTYSFCAPLPAESRVAATLHRELTILEAVGTAERAPPAAGTAENKADGSRPLHSGRPLDG